jgi:hypothetical protein
MFHLMIINVLALEQRLILGMGREMSCIFLGCVGLLLDGMCGSNEVTHFLAPLCGLSFCVIHYGM